MRTDNPPPDFHFASDIELKSKPLLEAWLEIRWQLEPGELPGFDVDPSFPFALGIFYNSIRDEFPFRNDLDAANAPVSVMPYIVRHQFWTAEGQWPLLQLGPGVATLNFADPYSWELFRSKALYLRAKLLNAYADTELKTQSLALRYRNGLPFECYKSDPLAYLRTNLNTSLALPIHIPGRASALEWPVDVLARLSYDLTAPKGTGIVQVGTARRLQQEHETGQPGGEGMLLWQLEVVSVGAHAVNLTDETSFCDWLTSAHAVLHEWFFSLVNGPLFDRFRKE